VLCEKRGSPLGGEKNASWSIDNVRVGVGKSNPRVASAQRCTATALNSLQGVLVRRGPCRSYGATK